MDDARGYMGRVLDINLTDERVATTPLDPDLAARFLGGRGIGAKMLYDNLPPGTDPLSPDNILILATGPLTGTSAPGSKMSLVSKSPLTGGYGDSTVGGYIGPEVKYAGYDAVIIRGRSARPTCLWIDGDRIAFRNATHLWGRGCFATERALKDELGNEAQILCIGPAGENLVKVACITHEFGRQAGRCGMGTVMGSKNLKAIAVRGEQGIRLADPDAFQTTVHKLHREMLENPVAMHWREFGTAGHILMSQEAGCLPTRNYQSGVFEQAEAISGEAMRESGLVVKNKACLGCTIGCGVWSRVGDLSVDGPEYETLAMLGSNCGIARLEAVARANWLCDDLGIDTISTGNIIAFTMECYERGIIGDEETGGLALRFGDETAYFRLMEMIARREGIGDILAEGVRQAARHFRKGAERIAMHSKGLEQSGYETRGGIGQVLGYAVVDRGADHNRIWSMGFFTGNRRYSPGGKAEMVKRIQCNRSAPDLMGQCRFVSYYVDFDDYATLITAATGRPSTGQDIRRTAERVFNLTRVFNIREGYTRADDHVPPRVFEEPVPDGPAAGHRVDRAEFEALLDEFYALSGWDRDGVPTQATLLALDLPDVAADLEAMGRA